MSRLTRNTWTSEVKSTQEDNILTELVARYGLQSWSVITEALSSHGFKHRTGKQCRERWLNQLDPSIKQDNWTIEEANKIFTFAKNFGKKWSQVAALLPGRTENGVKNYFYSTVRKNIRRINKKLIFDRSIEGTIDELMRDEWISSFVFCSGKGCLKKIEEFKLAKITLERIQEGVENSFLLLGSEGFGVGWQNVNGFEGFGQFGTGSSGLWSQDSGENY